VVLVLAVALLHREVLFSGSVYHMDDAADGYYPSHVAIDRAYREGHLPTWERGSWSGFPLLSDPYYGAFYPLSLTFPLFGMVRGLGINIALHMLLGSVGMLLLLRRRGLGQGPALLGAAALGLSSFMVERIRHIIFPQLLCWLPFVFFFAEGFLQSGRRRELAGLALCLGLGLICGGLPLLPFVGLILVAYLLPRALRAAQGLADGLTRLAWLFGAGVVGLLCAMAQIVPTLAHLPHSPRLLGADYAFASTYAWPHLSYLASLIAPDVYGGTLRGTWHGAYNHWEMAGWYVGALVVLLAPLGLLRHRGRAELWGLAGVALLGIGLAFGDAGPLHPWFFRHVPIYAALRCPVRALFMFLVAAPILGAEGLAWLLSRLPAREREGGRGRTAAILVGAGLVLLGGAVVVGVRGIGAMPQHLRGALQHLAVVLALGGALLVLIRGRVFSAGLGGGLMALLTVADLVIISRGYVQPQPADFAVGTERFAAVNWLIAQRPTDRFAIDPQGPFRLHNLGMTYGLEGAVGYDSFSIWRYVHYLYVLNHGAPYPHRQLRHDPAAGDIQRFDSPLVDLLNVRWVIGHRQPAPGWIERYRLPQGAPLHARHEPIWDPLLRVYENPHPLPRAFVVYAAEVVPVDGEERAQARALARLDPRTTVLLEEPPVPAPQSDGTRSFTPARIVRVERHQLVIEAELPAPGVLVVSEPHYPGWSATVDGAPAPLLRADYALRGVALPAGRHVVEMRFRSRPAELGLALSGLGIFGLLLLGLSSIGEKRRFTPAR
jgi:hypothetical protein